MSKSKRDRSKNIVEAGEAPPEGHNVTGQFDPKRLKKFVIRVEKREADKREAATDISTIYKEAEAAGLNSKAIRQIVKNRRKDADQVTELEETIRIYTESLGAFSNTPLGKSAKDDEEE